MLLRVFVSFLIYLFIFKCCITANLHLDFIFQLGPLFSLYLAGDTLTFLFDSKEYRIFFESENVDFLKTVQEPVERAGKFTTTVTFATFF